MTNDQIPLSGETAKELLEESDQLVRILFAIFQKARVPLLFLVIGHWSLVHLAAQDLSAAKALYDKRCAQCHGVEGKGDGPAAEFVDPKPRDFTRGQYKFRTTVSGALPTDDDLLKVVSEGIPGTSMTAFKDDLTLQERKQLVGYVKSFYSGFENASPEIFKKGKRLKGGADMIAKGQDVYQKMMCFSCHGQAGRGNGASAFTLKDGVGHPIFPANLNQNWEFRGGPTADDIYTRLMTGLNGTPMPSYADALESEEDRWALAHYVQSLSRPRNLSSVLAAEFVEGDLPLDPGADAWNEIDFVDFPFVGQVVMDPRLFEPAVTQVSVKALYNDQAIAFLLSWDDRTESLSAPATPPPASATTGAAAGVQAGGGATATYADGFAMQFPVGLHQGSERPYFLGGDSNNPVNLWHWKNGDGASEMNSTKFAEWAAQSADSQQLKHLAVYEDGRWRLVIQRDLTTAAPDQDVQFRAGRFTPIAFFAWEGYEGNHGAQCSISTWYDVVLKPQTPLRVYAFPPLIILGAGFLQWWGVRKVRSGKLKAES